MRFASGKEGRELERKFMEKYHSLLEEGNELVVELENKMRTAKTEEEKKSIEYEMLCFKEAWKENAWERAKDYIKEI